MNRGHLVGYQFSGLNDEGRNLVPMTAWLNTGAFTGTDDRNQSSMLYMKMDSIHGLQIILIIILTIR